VVGPYAFLGADKIPGRRGDQEFFKKCFERTMEFRREGKKLICVSHALQSLEMLSDHALWLEHGRVMRIGPCRQVLKEYAASAGTPPPSRRNPMRSEPCFR
jgi:ABC-type polysaccharide/polyol phosphate transport system ATPase subunit